MHQNFNGMKVLKQKMTKLMLMFEWISSLNTEENVKVHLKFESQEKILQKLKYLGISKFINQSISKNLKALRLKEKMDFPIPF